MADVHKVSVQLELDDKVSKGLSAIIKSFDKVLTAAEKYDKILNQIYSSMVKLNGVNIAFPMIPTGKSGKVINPNIAPTTGTSSASTSKLTALKTNMDEYGKVINGVITNHRILNAEVKRLPDTVHVDVSKFHNETTKILNTLKQIATTEEQISSLSVTPNNIMSTNLALKNVRTVVESVEISLERMNSRMANGSFVGVKDVTETFKDMTDAMTYAEKVHKQLVKAMQRSDLPDEEFKKLEIQAKALEKCIYELDTGQRFLTDTVRKSIPNYTNYQKALQNTQQTTKNLDKDTTSLTKNQARLNYKVGQGATVFTSFKGTLKSILGLYVGMEAMHTAFDWSDELTLTQGKLAQLTDDVDGFMSKIYQMSQDTRTSYMDNASQIAKMWQLTGGTNGIFETEDKLIQFNELLNKAFTLGGSGPREINSSLYQLTQALSSGRLQGDELRSLGENAPYLINAVKESILEMYNASVTEGEKLTDLTYNQLKKLGSEGVLTSEVIVNAVLRSSDKIREAYENIQPTFEQTFIALKNQIQKVLTPVLKKLNEMLNSEAFQKTTQAIVKMFAVAMTVLTPVLDLVMAIGSFISDNWSYIEPIVWGIVGALAVYFAYTKLAAAYTIAAAIAKGIYMVATLGATYSETAHAASIATFNVLMPIATMLVKMHGAAMMFLTGATWSAVVAEYGLLAPILLIIGIIVGLIAVIYGVVWAYNKWTDSTVSATGIIMGAFYTLGAFLYNRIADIWNLLVSFAELITNLFTDPVYAVKKAFGDMAIYIIDAWIKVNNALISIVDSIADTINGLLSGVESMINGVVDIYNNTLGKQFGKWNKASIKLTSDPYKTQNAMLNAWKSGIQNWIGEPGDNYISLDKYKMEKKDYAEMYNKGYGKGESWSNFFDISELLNSGMSVEDILNQYGDVPGMEDYLNSVPNYDDPSVPTTDNLPDDLMNSLKNIEDDVDDIDDMTKEELKYLRDIAEQKVINRFTTAEIKVTNHMNNNINSDRDIDGMADYFAEVLMKAADTTAERINTTG